MGAAPAAAPMTALATLVITILIVLRARGAVRLWGSVIGAVAGCLVAAGYGIYDMAIVADAAWFGVPAGGWPGFDLSLSPAFWAMLPAFIFVTLVGAIETIGDGMAIQRVSWRERAGHRLPGGAGGRGGRRRGQPAVRPLRDGPEHDLFEQRLYR